MSNDPTLTPAPSPLLTTLAKLRERLPEFRAHKLNRVSTRRLWIDPTLDALGWNVENPSRVQLAATLSATVGAEYVLRLQGQPIVALDAWALDEAVPSGAVQTTRCKSLARAGVPWYVQTNGATWRVYATGYPKTPILTATLSMIGKGESAAQVAEAMSPLDREAVIRGSLTAMLNAVRFPGEPQAAVQAPSPLPLARPEIEEKTAKRGRGAPRSLVRLTPDEASHMESVPDETQALYMAVRQAAMATRPTGVRVVPQSRYVTFRTNEAIFATAAVRRNHVKVWLPIDPDSVSPMPEFGRDVRAIGHVGSGDLELTVSTLEDVDAMKPYLVRACRARTARATQESRAATTPTPPKRSRTR
jgi:predicted transport protein